MRRIVVAAAVAIAASASALFGQSASLVHIVLIQGTPKGAAPAEIHMMRAPESRNVIVVSRKATAFDLEMAVDMVRHARATLGDTLTKDIRAVAHGPSPNRPAPGSAAARRRASMAENLAALDKSKSSNVPGFGIAKMLDLVVERRAANVVKR